MTNLPPRFHIPPGVALLLAAPLLGELVSGHQAPSDFFQPLTFLLLALPYGFGAVLCRELALRWGRGRWSLLPLAIAYGLFEEGIVVRSFFNPAWSELDALQSFGYSFGVHWLYALLLIQFHVTISIGASILLVELLYPQQRNESWVGVPGLVACGIGLALWVPAGIFLMIDYMPDGRLYAAVWFLFAGLIASARFLPWERLRFGGARRSPPAQASAWRFGVLGFANVTITFLFGFFVPELVAVPFLPLFTGLILVQVVSLVLLLSWTGNGWRIDDRHRFMLLVGLLGFFLLFGFLADLEQFQGKSLVSLAMIGWLWLIGRSITKGKVFDES
jgi:hypothetical protein